MARPLQPHQEGMHRAARYLERPRPVQPLRVLFAVQGEGRGHMTQALAAAEMLRQAGHTVVGAVVGTSGRRTLPAFFAEGLDAPVWTYPSPNFVTGPEGAVRPCATAIRAVLDGRSCSASLDRFGAVVERTDPDVIVNFYEALVGAYTLVRFLDVPIVAVGHQFMMAHPAYPLAPGQPVQRAALRAYTRLAGAGAAVRLGLSFYPAPDLPERRLRVVPPLLRQSLFRLDRRPAARLSLLVYLMEPALAPQFAAWSDRTPGVQVDCFSDVPAGAHSERLTFHGLCGRRFLERMATASGVVCTAGFESVSEALWLGTPALMLPVPKHYEQRCNALDAVAVGAGRAASGLRAEAEAALDGFVDDLRAGGLCPAETTERFRAWTSEAAALVVSATERAAVYSPGAFSAAAIATPMEPARPRATS